MNGHMTEGLTIVTRGDIIALADLLVLLSIKRRHLDIHTN